MFKIISTLLEAMGIKSVGTPLVILAGLIFSFAGAATWLREDAINDTNQRWEAKIAVERIAAHNALAEKQLDLEKVQKQLALKEQDDENKRKNDQAEVEKQKVDFPLSPECMRCRVPNERIWVRGDKTNPLVGARSSVSKPGS